MARAEKSNTPHFETADDYLIKTNIIVKGLAHIKRIGARSADRWFLDASDFARFCLLFHMRPRPGAQSEFAKGCSVPHVSTTNETLEVRAYQSHVHKVNISTYMCTIIVRRCPNALLVSPIEHSRDFFE